MSALGCRDHIFRAEIKFQIGIIAALLLAHPLWGLMTGLCDLLQEGPDIIPKVTADAGYRSVFEVFPGVGWIGNFGSRAAKL
jgi:hypothetical protein